MLYVRKIFLQEISALKILLDKQLTNEITVYHIEYFLSSYFLSRQSSLDLQEEDSFSQVNFISAVRDKWLVQMWTRFFCLMASSFAVSLLNGITGNLQTIGFLL